MKKVIIVFLSAFMLISCSRETESEAASALATPLPPYTLHIKPFEFEKTDSTNTLLLETTLWNNTKDTLKYLSMTCSWEEVYTFSNPKVEIPGSDCYVNVPTVISVIPESNAKTFFKVNLNGIAQGSKEKVKLGIKLVRVKDNNNDSETVSKLRSGKADILWSNEIEL